MADRRADETPLAPRRSLAGPSRSAESSADTGKRPLTERVSSAVAAAGPGPEAAAAAADQVAEQVGGAEPEDQDATIADRADTDDVDETDAVPDPETDTETESETEES